MVTTINKPWVQRALLALLLTSSLFYSLSQVTYWLYGDSANFIIDANKLRRGYFQENLAAHAQKKQGLPAVHNRLITEGGFPFLLWISRSINDNLPFILNAFIAPLFFGAMGWLLHLTDPKRGPPLAFMLLLIVFIVQFNMRFQIQRYCFPYRDMPAHTLALFALCFALYARTASRTHLWLALSGLFLGLGIWFRVPVFLFIPTAALILLLVLRDTPDHRRKLTLASAIALGGIAGLSPLFAQNVFEGKAFYQSGQMDIMVSSETLSTHNPGAATVSLANASFNAWPQLRLALIIFPIWVWVMIAIGFFHALLHNRLRAAILVTLALTFYLFYACYIKPVDRYIWMVNFMLLPFAVSWIARLLSPYHRIAYPLAILTAAGLFIGFGIHAGHFDDTRRVPRDTRKFTQWINQTVQDPTLVVTPSHAMQAWVSNYADLHIDILKYWTLYDRDKERKIEDLTAPIKSTPYDLAFMSFGGEDQKRLPSVWRTDILNTFQLDPIGEQRPLRYTPFTWLGLEKIVPRNRLREEIQLEETAAQNLYYAAKAYETRDLKVRVTSSEAHLTDLILATGPNLVPLTNPHVPTVTLTSDTPLPAFEAMRLSQTPMLRHEFRGYSNMTSVSNYVQGVNFFVYHYADWSRDWGHIPKFKSSPVVRLFDGSQLRIPPQPPRQSLRVYITARVRTNSDVSANPLTDLTNIYYQHNDTKLEPTIWFMGPPYTHNRHTYQDVIHDIYFPAPIGDARWMTVKAADVPQGYDLLMLRTEYHYRNEGYESVHPQGSVLYTPRKGAKWSAGIPRNLPSFDKIEKSDTVDEF